MSGVHCHITFELTVIKYTRPIAAHTDKHFQPGTQRRGAREAKYPRPRVTWGRWKVPRMLQVPSSVQYFYSQKILL